MNILPKKSWHVRSRRNIERVRRDEAEAEHRAKLEQDRVLQVEQEHRMRELRNRRGLPEPGQGKHFTLFPELEAQSTSSPRATNVLEKFHASQDEPDVQVKQQTAWNKLGRPTDSNTPWYLHKPSQAALPEPQARTGAVSDRFASSHDPMRKADGLLGRAGRDRQRVAVRTQVDSRQPADTSSSRCRPRYHCSRAVAPVIEIDSSPEILQVVGPKRKHKEHKSTKRTAR